MKRSMRLLISLAMMVTALSLVGFGAYAAGVLSQTVSIAPNIAFDPMIGDRLIAASAQYETNIEGVSSPPTNMMVIPGNEVTDTVFSTDEVITLKGLGDTVIYRLSVENTAGMPVDIVLDFAPSAPSFLVEVCVDQGYLETNNQKVTLEIGQKCEYEIFVKLVDTGVACAYTQPIHMKVVRSPE